MLKSSITILYAITILVAVLLVGCVSDDQADFPNNSQINITSNAAVVSLLKNLVSETDALSEDQQCFKFNYPIVLGYNNDSNISIESYAGLLSTIAAQSSNFNITGVQFPIEITFRNTSARIRIENEQELLSLLTECGYTSLRDEFERLFRQCFTFDFPVTVLDSIKREVPITTDQEFDTFFNGQNKNYQPEFKFPLNLLVGSDAVSEQIQTYFDFYEVVDACPGCPSIRIDSSRVSNTMYRFIADFEIKPEYELFWIVDQETFPFVEGENAITRGFDFGLHKVCIKATSPDCLSGIEECKDITVCPELFFIAEQEGVTTTYTFAADFPEIQDVPYKWLVNGEFQENDGGPGADNMFTFQFEPGSNNEVCILSEITGCAEISKFCVQIEVPQ
ncbi:hypothetical protein [Aquimarina mytili]|uniref:Uncharacterized protein n=1 Tax=Aquimarina mytili TaxID=874423 RepID=A0A936ZZY1_9FLAO|nr:hypothetical protein [Aquimarina mytili]MBL0684271.1 hypothetical protein [Aquimarina mytili]